MNKNPSNLQIRAKVLDTLTEYEKFWLIYKGGSFGLAGLLDLQYKRSYIELIFNPPNSDSPPLEIISPLVNELNFNPIMEKLPKTIDGIVDPKETLKLVLRLADNTVQAYNYILQNEIRKLDEIFENYPIDGDDYHRQFFVYLPGFKFEINIDFSKYPRRPVFSFSKPLSKLFTVSKFNEHPTLKQWNELNPVNIAYLLNILIEKISKILKRPDFSEESQQIIFQDVITSNEFQKFSFQVHRGQSLGVINNSKKSDLQKHDFMMSIFRAITGMQQHLSGEISLFGSTKPLENCSIVSQTVDSDLESYNVKNALFSNLTIYPDYSDIKRKVLQKKVLDTIGLANKRKERLSELSIGERIRFNIGRAVLQTPEVILLLLQEGSLNLFEIEQFTNYLENIKREFHSIFIISGIQDIASKCDKVLTLTDLSANTGFVEELVLQIPQAGEIITLELNEPPLENLENMLKIENALFIEERQYEKYKIYSQENPDNLILKILDVVGPFLYKFKRKKPKLEDYLQFKLISDEK